MELVRIESRKSEKVKQYCRLLENKKARNKEGLFCLEGVRLCMDAYFCSFPLEAVFVTESALSKNPDDLEILCQHAKKAYLITPDVAEKMADTVTTQGVFCIVQAKPDTAKFALQKGKCYVALDHVQNPDNLGAIARTAEALGIAGLLVQGGCDRYNPKAMRASMGSLLRLPILEVENLEETLAAQKERIYTFATVPRADAKDIRTLDFRKGAIAVIGNEGNGVCEAVQNAVQDAVTIPMLGRAESLNAATAATITMWEMMK